MRLFLDRLYLTSGILAGLMLFGLLTMVVIQMVARWSGLTVTGLTEIAGYCMAATSFLALGYAFHEGSHIRVGLIIGKMGRDRRYAEIFCTVIAIFFAGLMAYYGVKATYLSYAFHEISQGQDAMPIWIPQLAMSFGTCIFFIALLDHLIVLLVNGEDALNTSTLSSRMEER